MGSVFHGANHLSLYVLSYLVLSATAVCRVISSEIWCGGENNLYVLALPLHVVSSCALDKTVNIFKLQL